VLLVLSRHCRAGGQFNRYGTLAELIERKLRYLLAQRPIAAARRKPDGTGQAVKLRKCGNDGQVICNRTAE